MADSVGRHLRERLVVTYDEDGKVLQRRIVIVYDEGESPWYDPSTRHGEPPPKKRRKNELSEQELAASSEEREQLSRQVVERRLRKAAERRLRRFRELREALATARDAAAAAARTPRPSLDPAGADGADAAAAALADPPAPATLRAAPSASADADKALPMDLDAPAATRRWPAGLPPHQAWTTVKDIGRKVPIPVQRQCPRTHREKMMMDLASGSSARTDRVEGFGTPSLSDACSCCSSGNCTSDDPSPPQQPDPDDEAPAPAPAPARPPVVRDAAPPAPARPAAPSRDALKDLELWPGATLNSTAASFSEQGFTSLDYVRIARALQGFFPGLRAHQLIYHSSVDELLAAYYPDADAEAAEPLRVEPSSAPTKALDDKTDAPVKHTVLQPGDEITLRQGKVTAIVERPNGPKAVVVRVIKDEKGLVDASKPDVRQRYGRLLDGSEPVSRFWGVKWNRSSKKWEAYYTDADGEHHHVGCFFDEETAARARDDAVRAARLEGKRDMNVDDAGSLVPKPVCGIRSRGRAAAVAPLPPRARPRRAGVRYAVEAIDEADNDEADEEPSEEKSDESEADADGIFIAILRTDIDSYVSKGDATAAAKGETRKAYDARIAKEAAARKEGPPPPIPIDDLSPKADPGSSRMGKEATAERPAEQWASYVDEAGQTYYYNTMESDEAKVQDVVKRYHSIICEETKKEDPYCYFTGGKVVVKDKEATAKLFGYKSWGAVLKFFSDFQFRLVGGGVRGCPWSVYQHEHFRADGADLHLVQRNDEGARCFTYGNLRTWCPHGCCDKDATRTYVPCGNGRCEETKRIKAYCHCGRDGCGSGLARQLLARAMRIAFAMGKSSEEIDELFGMTPGQLRRYLIAASHYGEDTVKMWNEGMLQIDHVIPMRELQELLGAFVKKDGDKQEPTLAALMANCIINLNLLLKELDGRKSDTVTEETEQGIERRYEVLMRAVELTTPGTGVWIYPHPTEEMDKVEVDMDILCELMEEDVAANGGEIGCEHLKRY